MYRIITNLLAIAVCVALCFLTGTQVEQYRTQDFLKDIQATAKVQAQVRQAQQYAGPLTAAVRNLTDENASLVDRERRAAEVVAGLREESTRLKASLKEAVENLQSLDQTNNDLQQAIEALEFKVQTLEEALKAIQAVKDNTVPTPVATPDPPKNVIPKK